MTNKHTGINFSTDDEALWGAAHETEAACAVPPIAHSAHSAQPRRYTCDELGVCQGLDLVCTSCKPVAHPYAPGTITTDPASMLGASASQGGGWAKYLLVSAGIALTVMMVSGVAGYLWAVAP